MCFFVVASIFHSETKIVVHILIAYSGLGLCVRSRLEGFPHGRWCEGDTGRGVGRLGGHVYVLEVRGKEDWKGYSGWVALDRDTVKERQFMSRSMCLMPMCVS